MAVWVFAPENFWNMSFISADFVLHFDSYQVLADDLVYLGGGGGYPKISHQFCANPTSGYGGRMGRWGRIKPQTLNGLALSASIIPTRPAILAVPNSTHQEPVSVPVITVLSYIDMHTC